MDHFGEVVIAYGKGNEYSFVLKPSATCCGRSASQIQASFASMFAACYILHWGSCFSDVTVALAPVFNSSIFCLPTFQVRG